MLALIASSVAASLLPTALSASTVTFYAVPSGPTGLAGTSPSISPVSTGSDGSTTYKYDWVVTQVPSVTFGASQTLDFGTGFPFGGLGPFNLPGSPTTTMVDVPKTTLEATLVADSTHNVLSYNGPRATGTAPSYPSFIQDCRFSDDHSQGTCQYTEGSLRTSNDGQGNANSMNQVSFDGNVVPVYSAVMNGNDDSKSASETTMLSTSTDKDGSTRVVTMTQTATAPGASGSGQSTNNRTAGAVSGLQGAVGVGLWCSVLVVVMSAIFVL